MPTQDGFLVIADVSGYTAFLTSTELEHGHAVMQGILGVLVKQLEPPATLIKLEGDAVFFRAPALLGGTRVFDLIERLYAAFRAHRFDTQKATSCTCRACASIDTLDLKFFAHFGRFAEQRLGGIADVAGPDVILVHRLTKNSVTERLNQRAYLLGTRAFLERVEVAPKVEAHSESYEHLGEVQGGVYDLAAWYARHSAEKQDRVEAADADFVFQTELDAPPMQVWDWFTHPAKKHKLEPFLSGISYEPNAHGRVAADAVLHCAHEVGEIVVRYVDWKPFRYFTAESVSRGMGLKSLPAMRNTIDLEPLDGGARTRVDDRIRFQNRNPIFLLAMKLLRGKMKKEFDVVYGRLAAGLREEAGAAAAASEPQPEVAPAR
jgi:hypothetical protein